MTSIDWSVRWPIGKNAGTKMRLATSETTLVMKPLVSVSTEQPLEASSAKFKAGVRSVPYLADHGFQDMIVLPGSFYIELALRMDCELFKRTSGVVRNATFQNPIILSAEDTVISVEASDGGGGRAEYSFYEADAEVERGQANARQAAARLEIQANQSSSHQDSVPAFSIEAFQAQAQAMIGADRFYEKLRENGNQYGPHFQKVSAIWRAGDQILGRLSVPRQTEPPHLHPILLDSITQLLASFILENRQTFVLRAIEKIEIINVNFPDTLWGHATRLTPDAPHPVPPDEPPCYPSPPHPALSPGGGEGGRRPDEGVGQGFNARTSSENSLPHRCGEGAREREVAGNIRVFDESGRTYLELSGVAFTLLERVDPADEKSPANLVIAANFTADPLEDPLNFWGDYFGDPIRTEFAPYNQVFQQLLDPASAFRKNRDGVKVILLGLEEWAASERTAGMTLDRERAAQCFGNRARYVLPNGLEIVHLNPYETDYVYQEIFEDQCYLKHGIRLQDGDTVVDIGANIGLFSLFVMSRCKNPRIYAFEPAPVVYDLLQANCQAHGPNARAVNAGVSDRARTATFTFYERSSVFSSFHADEAEDLKAVQTVVRNMLKGESATAQSVEEYVKELTADRLRRRTCECQLTSVSDILRENQIDTINLLKIDAEKSEWDILKGIEDADWPRISQIVMEIHDRTGVAVKRIKELLSEKGYRCAVEREKRLEHSGLCNLYAIRGDASRKPLSPSLSPSDGEREKGGGDCLEETSQTSRRVASLYRTIGEFRTALRSFMNQEAAPLVLCVTPRTPATESDAELKAALNEAEQTLLSEAGTIPNVHTISSALLLRRYPVQDHYDAHRYDLGHIPYTADCYAAIATALFRARFSLKRRPFKVIVLDCDNTLWNGVCGEAGPRGIEVSSPFRALQEFMIEQMHAGMLLCLCSKNNERDVLAVFEQQTDMPLKREHLVSWRINWNAKSENVKSLAQELDLGLDSFIFVDDNPVDCADVRINCPGVLTLQLPRNAESFPSFLNHIWAFDHSGATEEDHQRTRMYQQSAKRQQFREQSLSLKDYVKGLHVRVEIAEATEDQLGRVSQLTFRTNQFNFTTLRRSEKEIREFLNRAGAHCLVVRVVDRFGDYGLVGVLMYEAFADRFKVDTFLLSCRVLGRGVEHAVVSHLGQRAVAEGKQFVEFTCQPTEKNRPAREFITRIGDPYRNDGSTSCTFPAEKLASVEYDPDRETTGGREEKATVNQEKLTPHRAGGLDSLDLSERLQRIGEELYDTSRLSKAIEEYRLTNQPLEAAVAVAPGSTLTTALLDSWRKVLGRPRIGLNDNFFEAGGTSLRAVQVIAMIKKTLKKTLSIVTLFECPTVALLAAKLGSTSGGVPAETPTSGAALRGRQRRHTTKRRKAA